MSPRRLLVVAAAAVLAVVSLVAARRTDPAGVRAAVGAAVAPGATTAGAATPGATTPGATTAGAATPAAPARLPVLSPGPAPDVAALASGWLNGGALAPANLEGKVVLYDLWTFGCINCQHTTPSLRSWYARYAADGLVIVGVHSPEFDYEADPANVAKALVDQRIAYPVALDPDHRVWRAFDNHYWPVFYLYDREGRRRYVHIGEGAYAETEDALRSLLGVDPASPRAAPV